MEKIKIITINVSEQHLAFFEVLKKLGLIPSRSEALRHCIDIAMPYYYNMINFLKNPLDDVDLEQVKETYERLKIYELEQKQLEYTEQLNLKPEFRKPGYQNLPHAKAPIGNKYWKDVLIDGKWVKKPVEPDSTENEVFIDGLGYVPESRLKDVPVKEE